MSKIRQDAWSEEDDLLLAETVLRHVREGSTQLHAFEEVGDQLERTSAAVGFRWNAIVRKRYEQALKIAKKQRKERQRAFAQNQQQPKPPIAEQRTNTVPTFKKQLDDETYHPEEFFKTPFIPSVPEVKETEYMPSKKEDLSMEPARDSKSTELTLEKVIFFLEDLQKNGLSSQKKEYEITELRLRLNETMQENSTLKSQVSHLEKEYKTIQEDYQALIQIMDRARRMVLLDESAESQSFRMDKNGNLERVAK